MPNMKLNYSDEFIEIITKQMEILNEKYKNVFFLGEQEHPEQQRFHCESTVQNISRNIHYGELLLENTPEEILAKEAESVVGMNKEEIIAEINGYKDNPANFIEYLIGRKLSIYERSFLEFYSKYSLPCISPIQYKPLFLIKDSSLYPSLAFLLGIDKADKKDSSFVTTVNCSAPFMRIDTINHNLRLYDHETIHGCLSIDKFVEELKLSGQWYIISPIKNKSEDLQPYKDIVYPWDYEEDAKEIHRKEIKAKGENRYDIHSKSGRNNRKRRKVV